ncbi:MAG: OmpA family protein [Flavobacteriia bacterium]|nr:OmpA family protein [Flavobacteriia bacterium]
MRNIILFLIFSFSLHNLWGQSERISDCDGALNILNPGTYNLQFSGKGGIIDEFQKYPSLKELKEENSIWCSFVAPFNGRLSINAKVANGNLKMLIFRNETNDMCGDIVKGIAEIKRMIIKPTQNEIGLSLNYDDNFYYPMELIAGESIMICFFHTTKEREKLDLKFKYEPISDEPSTNSPEIKIVDQRTDKNKPAFSILVRDAETGNPVIADLVISGLKSISSFYQGSDFFFNMDKSGKIAVRVDCQGYFFTDREEPVSPGTEHELVIWLEPIGEGKSVQLDEIEFVPGTSEFLPSSEPKLRRLRDFLALNAGINVEIQGHVQELGENSFAGQKISEARAKRVLNYLVENGIDKKRLTSKGYGNTRPIYPTPKFAYEEQANRRVEIKIL